MPSSTLIYQLLSKNLANIQLSLQLFGLLKNVVLDFNAPCRFVFYKPMTPHLSIFCVLQAHDSTPVHILCFTSPRLHTCPYVSATKKELESVKKKFTEASEQIQEKGRQYHKLQVGLIKCIYNVSVVNRWMDTLGSQGGWAGLLFRWCELTGLAACCVLNPIQPGDEASTIYIYIKMSTSVPYKQLSRAN